MGCREITEFDSHRSETHLNSLSLMKQLTNTTAGQLSTDQTMCSVSLTDNLTLFQSILALFSPEILRLMKNFAKDMMHRGFLNNSVLFFGWILAFFSVRSPSELCAAAWRMSLKAEVCTDIIV